MSSANLKLAKAGRSAKMQKVWQVLKSRKVDLRVGGYVGDASSVAMPTAKFVILSALVLPLQEFLSSCFRLAPRGALYSGLWRWESAAAAAATLLPRGRAPADVCGARSELGFGKALGWARLLCVLAAAFLYCLVFRLIDDSVQVVACEASVSHSNISKGTQALL